MSQRILAPVIGLAVFLALWELWVRIADIPPFILRAPSDILATLADDPAAYLRNTLVTGREALIGFLLAFVIAIPIGALLASSRWLEHAATPILVLIQVTPFAAYAASVVVWLSPGWKPIVFITALVCMVPFTFATVSGMRAAEPAALDVLRSVDAARWEIGWRLRLPSALPQLFTAAKVCVGLSLIAAWLTEQYALVTHGLGVLGKRAVAFNDGDLLWASVFCTAALGMVGLLLVGLLERGVLRWHASQR